MRHEHKLGATLTGDRALHSCAPRGTDSRLPRAKPKGVCARSARLAPRTAQFAPSRSLQIRQITRHTLSSNCRRNSLKINSRVPNYSTHFSRSARRARRGNLQFSDRKLQLLEPTLTQRKQTIQPGPNRKFSLVTRIGEDGHTLDQAAMNF